MKLRGIYALTGVFAALLAACGGGGNSESQKPAAPEVVGVMLTPEGAPALDEERLLLPPGSRSWTHVRVKMQSPGGIATFSAIPGINCSSPTLCKNRYPFELIQSVSLQTSAPIALEGWDQDRIRLVVDVGAPIGSLATLIVTDSTGQQVSRTYTVQK